MEKIIYNLVYNRKKCLNRRGMALVQVEAYLHRRKKYFSTRVYLKPDQWDARRAEVRNHPHASTLNRMLGEFVITLEQKELELWKQGYHCSLEVLKEVVTKGHHAASFLLFCRQEVERSACKESTKRNHLSTLALLHDFRKVVTFADITYELVVDFEHFLLGRGLHINTVAKHMKHLKRYVNSAISRGLLDANRYAFRQYRIKTAMHRHTHLLPEELKRFEQLNLEDRYVHLQQTLDAFLFCCYAGTRYSDFVRLSAGNFVRVQQRVWLVYTALKTGSEVRVPLYLMFDGRGVALLERYRGDLGRLFHLKDNSNVNKELAVLSRLAGVKKRVTFHTARHTNATLLIYKGVNITTVQKLLGHRNIKTTEVYAHIIDRTLVADLKKNTYR